MHSRIEDQRLLRTRQLDQAALVHETNLEFFWNLEFGIW